MSVAEKSETNYNDINDTLIKDKQNNLLVEKNLLLVHSLAKKFKGRGIEYEDLFQAGCIGLIKAINAFNPEFGVKLSTYAVPVILGEIKRLFRDGLAIKVSRSLKETSTKVLATKENFEKKYDREPTISEIAKILDIDIEQVTEAVCVLMPMISLTQNSDDEENAQFDIPTKSHEDEITGNLSLQKSINSLPKAEQEIIRLRYYKHLTQTEVGKILGMTQVSVSRKEKSILLKLKKMLL